MWFDWLAGASVAEPRAGECGAKGVVMRVRPEMYAKDAGMLLERRYLSVASPFLVAATATGSGPCEHAQRLLSSLIFVE